MTSATITIDLATAGTTILFMILSFAVGAIGTFAGLMLGFIGEVGIGFIEVLAGGRASSRNRPEPSKMPVFIRALLYFAAGIGAILLASNGMAGWSYLLGIVSSFCFGIAVVKLFK